MQMRLRLPDVLDEKQTTAYAVARDSGGRIDKGTLYRLCRSRGRVAWFSGELLEALCDVLGIADPGKLLEREPTRSSRSKRERKRG